MQHLHEGERLLVTARPSVSALLLSWIVGLADALVLIVLALGASILVAGIDVLASVWFVSVIVVIAVLLAWWRRWKKWKASGLWVTTDRIILEYELLPLGSESRTIKWDQYQESSTGPRHPVDILCGARALCIRFGTAKAEHTACFPSLLWAGDLKHYLDKVDSAVRAGQTEGLRPFVFKRRGQRDEAWAQAQ